MKTIPPEETNNSRGLGRIELLTLVATIAILGMLALPARSNSGSRSSRTQCVSNQRQMALATIQFANENRNRLPQNVSGSWPNNLPVVAANAMQPCGLTRDILYDPAYPGFNIDFNWDFFPQYRLIGYALTFPGTSILLPTNVNTIIDPQPFSIASLWLPATTPASRVLWADLTMSAPGQNASDPASRASYNYSSIPAGSALLGRTSHLLTSMPAGGNLAMLDGHVEWREFAPMIPRTASDSAPTFWW